MPIKLNVCSNTRSNLIADVRALHYYSYKSTHPSNRLIRCKFSATHPQYGLAIVNCEIANRMIAPDPQPVFAVETLEVIDAIT